MLFLEISFTFQSYHEKNLDHPSEVANFSNALPSKNVSLNTCVWITVIKCWFQSQHVAECQRSRKNSFYTDVFCIFCSVKAILCSSSFLSRKTINFTVFVRMQVFDAPAHFCRKYMRNAASPRCKTYIRKNNNFGDSFGTFLSSSKLKVQPI